MSSNTLEGAGLTYRKLITDDGDDVRFAADSHPVVSFHLLHNGLLRGAVVRIPFGSKSSEDWIPIEDQVVLLVIAIITK